MESALAIAFHCATPPSAAAPPRGVRAAKDSPNRDRVLECGVAPPLSLAAIQSARALAHSKTLSRQREVETLSPRQNEPSSRDVNVNLVKAGYAGKEAAIPIDFLNFA